MKNILFYIFVFLIGVNIYVHGLMSFSNFITLGVLLNLILRKQEKGSYSLWKLIVGIGITSCFILIGVARAFKLI